MPLQYTILLSRHARFRIDYEATQPISIRRVEEQPWVLKTLSLGIWRDVEVMEGLLRAFPRTLASVWAHFDSGGCKTGVGYNRSSRLVQKPAEFLAELKDFQPLGESFSVDSSQLRTYFQKFGIRSAHMPRRNELFQAPLVIIPQSPGDDPVKPRAFRSAHPLAFSQSYYGYSCAGHAESDVLSALLYLLPHSTLFSYFCLMTSRRTGFDRQTFNKGEFDLLPFPDIVELTALEKRVIVELAHELEYGRRKPWGEIDAFLFRLYKLDEDAIQVARDTIFSAASYRLKGRVALDQTRHQHRDSFRLELSDILEPYFDVCGATVVIEEAHGRPDAWQQPWRFLAISCAHKEISVGVDMLRLAMEEANKRSASRIIVRAPCRRGLLLGLLDQRRWWTISRARLCGQYIIRHHLEAFGLT